MAQTNEYIKKAAAHTQQVINEIIANVDNYFALLDVMSQFERLPFSSQVDLYYINNTERKKFKALASRVTWKKVFDFDVARNAQTVKLYNDEKDTVNEYYDISDTVGYTEGDEYKKALLWRYDHERDRGYWNFDEQKYHNSYGDVLLDNIYQEIFNRCMTVVDNLEPSKKANFLCNSMCYTVCKRLGFEDEARRLRREITDEWQNFSKEDLPYIHDGVKEVLEPLRNFVKANMQREREVLKEQEINDEAGTERNGAENSAESVRILGRSAKEIPDGIQSKTVAESVMGRETGSVSGELSGIGGKQGDTNGRTDNEEGRSDGGTQAPRLHDVGSENEQYRIAGSRDNAGRDSSTERMDGDGRGRFDGDRGWGGLGGRRVTFTDKNFVDNSILATRGRTAQRVYDIPDQPSLFDDTSELITTSVNVATEEISEQTDTSTNTMEVSETENPAVDDIEGKFRARN